MVTIEELYEDVAYNSSVVKQLKKLLKRVGKMEQMEYNYMIWEDELQKILGEK